MWHSLLDKLGQSLSLCIETLDVDVDEMEVIPDVVINHDGREYVFSYGIGKIYVYFAKVVP